MSNNEVILWGGGSSGTGSARIRGQGSGSVRSSNSSSSSRDRGRGRRYDERDRETDEEGRGSDRYGGRRNFSLAYDANEVDSLINCRDWNEISKRVNRSQPGSFAVFARTVFGDVCDEIESVEKSVLKEWKNELRDDDDYNSWADLLNGNIWYLFCGEALGDEIIRRDEAGEKTCDEPMAQFMLLFKKHLMDDVLALWGWLEWSVTNLNEPCLPTVKMDSRQRISKTQAEHGTIGWICDYITLTRRIGMKWM